MRLKHKIQHYLTITDGELKFLLVLVGLLLLGTLIKYVRLNNVPDFSERYAELDSLMAVAEASNIDSTMSDVEGDSILMDVSIPGNDPGRQNSSDLSTTDRLINLNTATPIELTALPGIGPAIAKRIVDYRKKYGRFERKEDLLNVRGIGPRTLEKLRSDIAI